MQECSEKKTKLYRMGCMAFFFSGICAMSSGVIVSMLQEYYGFAYGMTGTLLSLMNIGNLVAGFASAILPSRNGTRGTVLMLTSGYTLGYLFMTAGNYMWLLMLAFLLLGFAKGNTLNNCTVLVGNNSNDRTKGMNVMHASYACGALLGPILIAAALITGKYSPMYALAGAGVVLWFVFVAVRFPGKSAKAIDEKKEKTDWSFLREKKFWLLTGLIFCQNAAETSVTGWMVTYTGWLAILMLFAFSCAMAGVNPTGVAGAGNMLNSVTMGIMLPAAGLGAILMPWIIGLVAERVSLQAGMFCNIVPCAGILVFSILCRRLENRNYNTGENK